MARKAKRRYNSAQDSRKAKDYRLKYNYGISIEQFERLLMDQHGTCALCSRTEGLVVDHDHKTGDVRGILCGPCNRALGVLGDTDKSIINVLKYLKGIYGDVTSVS